MTILKKIRNLNFGWIIILLGSGSILAGLRMTTKSNKENTLLCFDEGCVTIQGISCMVLGILMIGIGLYKIFYKHK